MLVKFPSSNGDVYVNASFVAWVESAEGGRARIHFTGQNPGSEGLVVDAESRTVADELATHA